jgi:replicative superfamily II helicase
MDYQTFLENKKHSIGNFGFKANYVPDMAFDFQKYIIEKATLKGRIAIFADTGLGKTLIQLSIAKNIIQHTNKKVLILTPLAVAFQFILEAEKLGIDDIEYSKDGKHTKKIVICNYERLHYFDSNDFEGVILDESSILKNFDGKTKWAITSFLKKIPYRFLSTATPAPNDYIEFGTSSEALGYFPYMDMLTKFFANNENNVRPQDIGTKW